MLLAILLMAAAADAAPETDVLAQARAGRVLCVNPDPKSKTCSTIDTFVIAKDGAVTDVGELLIAADQPLTLEVASTVQIDTALICGSMELADLKAGRVRFEGQPVSPDRNAAVLDVFVERLKPLAGRRVCEVLRLEDGQLRKFGQVGRVDVALPGKPVQWVSPTEGYKVAPR